MIEVGSGTEWAVRAEAANLQLKERAMQLRGYVVRLQIQRDHGDAPAGLGSNGWD